MSTEHNRKKRQKRKTKRILALETADKKGWKQCSPYHFQRNMAGILINWWPSTNKAMIENQVYRVFDVSDIRAIIKTLGIPV